MQIAYKSTLTVMILLAGIVLPARGVVSTAPAITEIIFALGCGDRITGTTSFCDYPPAARAIPRIGGFIDLNLEKIIAIRPELIVHYPELRPKLELLGNRSHLLEIRHQTIRDLYEGIQAISRALNVEGKGRSMVASIRAGLQSLHPENKGEKVRLLLVAGRTPGEIGRMTLMGRGNFLDELMELLGGENAYRGHIPYPVISSEALLEMAPHGIIDLSAMGNDRDRRHLIREWDQLPPALHPIKVLAVKDPVWLRPGPRIVKTAREMALFIRSLRGLMKQGDRK